MDFGVFFDYPGGGAAGDERLLFLAGCSQQDWSLIREHAQQRRFAAGALVVGVGDSDRALLLVIDGNLEVVEPRRRARQNAPLLLGPGAVLGELAFLGGRPAAAAVKAVTDAQVLRLGLEEFEILAAKDPALGRYLLFDLARLLAERVRDLQELQRQGR